MIVPLSFLSSYLCTEEEEEKEVQVRAVRRNGQKSLIFEVCWELEVI